MYCWAFGDSVLDLEALKAADRAVVVVGDETNRSKSMERELKQAIDRDDLKAQQILLPNNVSPRLTTDMLPITDLEMLTVELLPRFDMKVVHATNKPAAKLLMRPMRDASNNGPALRRSHNHVGWYLATEYLTDVIGLEECTIAHVQGQNTGGHRLRNESRTAIVALMRGGEPMALAVNEALPLARFIHANEPEDLTPARLHGLSTLVLVDSVVNTGTTVVQFIQHIRRLHPTIPIVIVAGVVQAQTVGAKGALIEPLAIYKDLSLVALRLSDNKYTGTKATDTGNRLFNTTHLK